MSKELPSVNCVNRLAWHKWLSQNCASSDGIWLVFQKKCSPLKSVSYDDALDEALCFGWIDSVINAIDENCYRQKFTPRRAKSVWSEVNKKRIEKLINQNLMTEHGLVKINAAKTDGSWDKQPKEVPLSYDVHPLFQAALDANPTANSYFKKLAPSHQKRYTLWINMAKTDSTRNRRIDESIQLLLKQEMLGLK
jgi:uncharacterized protein YdeI (YjbR/CyaY-like superfamily)